MTIDSQSHEHILLAGPMAVGKSSVGAAAAPLLGREFVDLDRAVERLAGSSIERIFADSGEPRFRELERQTLRSLLDATSPLLIALGGGTLVDPALRDEAFERSVVVSLVAPASTLAPRIRLDGSRPLLDGVQPSGLVERVDETIRARRAAYAMAHAVVDASSGSIDDVAERIVRAARDRYVGVALGELSYGVRFTQSPWSALADTASALRPTRVFLLSDPMVANLYAADARRALLSVNLPLAGEILFAAGEENKTLAEIERALRVLIANRADRRSLLIGLGGGVVTDMTGFVAALFARGIRWVAVPTTLLAMVDASVGGKTGVDFGGAKNLVGAIHQPRAVIVDAMLSRTESVRATRSGMAELVKTLALGDAHLFEECESIAAGLGSPEELSALSAEWLERAIVACVRIKARIVSEDPREGGRRAILNFGHTLGHAFESTGAFSRFTHGEAVGLGMIAECAIGARLGVTAPSTTLRVARLLAKLGLPVSISEELVADAIPWLSKDKKRDGANVRLALLSDVGRPVLVDVPHEALVGLARELSSELWPLW